MENIISHIFIYAVALLWTVTEVKSILFWIYLWQLKDYHIGRLRAHFSTTKGKKILFNKFHIAKIILFLLFFASISNGILFSVFTFVLFCVIIGEGLWNLFKLWKGEFVKPVFTKKTIFLFVANLIPIVFLTFFFIFNILEAAEWFVFVFIMLSVFLLLLVNILTPLLVSLIILLFQPITVLLRNRILNKAKKKRRELDIKVIGITGSYGKTSVKEFLFTILSSKFKHVVKTEKHRNSEVGVATAILEDVKKNTEIFVCEMGAYNRGGIDLLCSIAQPQYGILTGINSQHLATFGSQENIVKAKFELIDYVDFGILNWDNYLIQKHKLDKDVERYSKNKGQDIWAEDMQEFKDHIEFTACLKTGEKQLFSVNVLGIHNVSNLLGCILMAKKLGMTLEEISRGCRNIEPWQGGMILKNNIIDATYSSNADGIIAHLDFMKNWKGKRAIVMPCLIELGRESERIHKEIAKKIKEVCDLAIITTEECFKDEDFIFLSNPDEIAERLKDFNNEEDIILLESRVPKELINKL